MRLTTEDCVIRLAKGERLSEAISAALDPPVMGSIHFFEIEVGGETELHFHDHDEYWLFTEGRTRVALRTPDGVMRSYDIEPYTLIATAKGVEHGHVPQTDVKGLEWVGPIAPGGRYGHHTRSF